jgi:hypothetical protein
MKNFFFIRDRSTQLIKCISLTELIDFFYIFFFLNAHQVCHFSFWRYARICSCGKHLLSSCQSPELCSPHQCGAAILLDISSIELEVQDTVEMVTCLNKRVQITLFLQLIRYGDQEFGR